MPLAIISTIIMMAANNILFLLFLLRSSFFLRSYEYCSYIPKATSDIISKKLTDIPHFLRFIPL